MAGICSLLAPSNRVTGGLGPGAWGGGGWQLLRNKNMKRTLAKEKILKPEGLRFQGRKNIIPQAIQLQNLKMNIATKKKNGDADLTLGQLPKASGWGRLISDTLSLKYTKKLQNPFCKKFSRARITQFTQRSKDLGN